MILAAGIEIDARIAVSKSHFLPQTVQLMNSVKTIFTATFVALALGNLGAIHSAFPAHPTRRLMDGLWATKNMVNGASVSLIRP